MLVLNILKLDQVGSVFLLYLLEPCTHLVHLLIEILIVLLYTQQFIFSLFLLSSKLLFFFLLLLQLILQLLDPFHLILVFIVWTFNLEVFLQLF